METSWANAQIWSKAQRERVSTPGAGASWYFAPFGPMGRWGSHCDAVGLRKVGNLPLQTDHRVAWNFTVVFIFLWSTVCNIVCVTKNGINERLPNSLWAQTSVSGFEFNLDHKGKLYNGILATQSSWVRRRPTGRHTGLPTSSSTLPLPRPAAGCSRWWGRSAPVPSGSRRGRDCASNSCLRWLFPQTVSEASLSLQSSSAALAWDFASTCLS